MNPAWWLNSAWMWSCRGEARRLSAAARQVRRCQTQLLMELVRANRTCRYGREHGLDRVRQAADFQRLLPLCDGRSLQPWLDRLAQGEPNLLTSEPVLLFEPTSGTSSPRKLIPYTATLRRQFQRAVAAWVYQTLQTMPAVRRGRAYWSISPALQPQQTTPGGVRIGFDSDTQYLAAWQRPLVQRLLAVPPEVARLTHSDNFQHATLCWLLSRDDLTLISIWSPTFLTSLLAQVPGRLDAICRDLHHGRLSWPSGDDPGTAWLDRNVRFPRQPQRAAQLAVWFNQADDLATALGRCWPHLALVSCWADGAAAGYLPALGRLLPQVPIQPKGLTATEGLVSLPVGDARGAALAIRSHFFEFVPHDAPGSTVGDRSPSEPCLLADELEVGRQYQVLLTTGGGLYRYQLGDVVEVTGHWQQCPLVRFLGRAAATSDLVGEKLHEAHVAAALAQACAALGLEPDFLWLAPLAEPTPAYRLFFSAGSAEVESSAAAWVIDQARAARLAQQVEQALRENPHYHLARQLGQLGPLSVGCLRLPPGEAWQRYVAHCRRQGQKPGDIKPPCLATSAAWSAPLVAELSAQLAPTAVR